MPTEVRCFFCEHTRGRGCEDNSLCVSTAAGFDRDSGSGTWQLLSATGKAKGAPVMPNDLIYLLNKYGGNGGYLDTRGRGCEDNLLCVSTATSSNRDGGSGTWRIFTDTPGEVQDSQPVHLLNAYNDFMGGYLDVYGNGCEDNLLCVSTTCGWNRDSGSTVWRFFHHTDPSLVENFSAA